MEIGVVSTVGLDSCVCWCYSLKGPILRIKVISSFYKTSLHLQNDMKETAE